MISSVCALKVHATNSETRAANVFTAQKAAHVHSLQIDFCGRLLCVSFHIPCAEHIKIKYTADL
jgi:hypothetical protein